MLNDFLSGSAAWGVLLTLAAFALGALINRITGKAIFNPLLLGSIFVIIFLSVCKIPYADYKASAAPVNYLLLPATVALAIPLYEKWDLLRENAAAIIAGISVGTLVSLGSALALALALDLTQEQYATLLPKSVTTAISMDVAAELGGIAALTGAIVILTGILVLDSNPLIGYHHAVGVNIVILTVILDQAIRSHLAVLIQVVPAVAGSGPLIGYSLLIAVIVNPGSVLLNPAGSCEGSHGSADGKQRCC